MANWRTYQSIAASGSTEFRCRWWNPGVGSIRDPPLVGTTIDPRHAAAQVLAYSLGLAVGRGEKLDDVLATRSAVTEGVATAPALVARAAGTDLPICSAVASLLTAQTTLAEAMAALLARPRRDE